MRSDLTATARALAFVLLALLLCAIAFEAAGYSSVTMLRAIAEGAFTSFGAWQNTLRWALPLFISACGVLVAFRAGFFNVGTQGQFYCGAMAAAFAMHFLSGMPPLLVIPLVVFAGMAGGAAWALWPGFLRLNAGANEVLTTLMGNFIAGLLLVYVTSGPLKDPLGTAELSATPPVQGVYRIASSASLSPVIIVTAIVVGITIWLLMNRTVFGILAGVSGRNPVMLQWQGASTVRVGLAAFLISGGLAGLAGAMDYLGPSGRVVSGFLPGHGFAAIVIALVGGLTVPGVAVAALFFGGLAAANLYLPVIAGLPSSAVDIINATIALLITARAWPRLPFAGSILRVRPGALS